MSKLFDIVMAGVISGIVAFTTTQIGIGGTILGAVLGSMLYQVMSHYIKEPLGKVETKKIETKLVYIMPLILIIIIEVIYLLVPFFLEPQQIFYFLQGATNWNLFRSIGIALIIMGLYPLVQSENIQRKYGYIIMSLGTLILLRGFIDWNSPIVDSYSIVFREYKVPISLMAILVLLYVIFSILKESLALRKKDKSLSEEDSNKDEKTNLPYEISNKKNN